MIGRILQRPVQSILIGLMLFLLLGVIIRSCSSVRQARQDVRRERAAAGAASDAAKDAIGAVRASDGRDRAIDKQIMGTQYEISNATGAADVDRAALDGLRRNRGQGNK